jgi:hypothetical protein
VGVKNRDVKQHFLMGDISPSMNQILELETAMATVEPPARLLR